MVRGKIFKRDTRGVFVNTEYPEHYIDTDEQARWEFPWVIPREATHMQFVITADRKPEAWLYCYREGWIIGGKHGTDYPLVYEDLVEAGSWPDGLWIRCFWWTVGTKPLLMGRGRRKAMGHK